MSERVNLHMYMNDTRTCIVQDPLYSGLQYIVKITRQGPCNGLVVASSENDCFWDVSIEAVPATRPSPFVFLSASIPAYCSSSVLEVSHHNSTRLVLVQADVSVPVWEASNFVQRKQDYLVISIERSLSAHAAGASDVFVE